MILDLVCDSFNDRIATSEYLVLSSLRSSSDLDTHRNCFIDISKIRSIFICLDVMMSINFIRLKIVSILVLLVNHI